MKKPLIKSIRMVACALLAAVLALTAAGTGAESNAPLTIVVRIGTVAAEAEEAATQEPTPAPTPTPEPEPSQEPTPVPTPEVTDEPEPTADPIQDSQSGQEVADPIQDSQSGQEVADPTPTPAPAEDSAPEPSGESDGEPTPEPDPTPEPESEYLYVPAFSLLEEPGTVEETGEADETGYALNESDVIVTANCPTLPLELLENYEIKLTADFVVTVTITNKAACAVSVSCAPDFGNNADIYTALGISAETVGLNSVPTGETQTITLMASGTKFSVTRDQMEYIIKNKKLPGFDLKLTLTPVSEEGVAEV